MSKFLFVFLFLVGVAAFAQTPEKETVSFSRYFTIKTCYTNKGCIGPVAKQIEAANTRIALTPFRKGDAMGEDGWDRQRLTEENIPFQSELHIMKHSNPGKHKFSLYVMLRSGKRNGVIKTFHFDDPEQIKQFTVTDKTIPFKGGVLQAQIVIGPKLNIDHPVNQ
jgi:hypothetical protein